MAQHLSVRDYVMQLVQHEVLRPLALLVEDEDDTATGTNVPVTVPPKPLGDGLNDEVCSTPSTVCSVVSTSTITPAQKPLCTVLGGAAAPIYGATMVDTTRMSGVSMPTDVALLHPRFDVPQSVVRGVLDAMAMTQHTSASSTPTKTPRTPSSRVMASLATDLMSITINLLAGGYTTEVELFIALALVQKATTPAIVSDASTMGETSSDKKGGALLRVTNANARRVVIAAVRLAAKCHSDEYFSIKDMCRAASLSTTEDFHSLVAECEWKMFLSLDMDCAVSPELLEAVMQRAWRHQQESF